MCGHLSRCTKYIVVGAIALMVASYSEEVFKGAEVSTETVEQDNEIMVCFGEGYDKE